MTQITTINPATEETIASYDLTSADTAFKKIEACHAAFLEWQKMTHNERAPYLRDIAKALREKSDEFASLMTQETAKHVSRPNDLW